MGPQETVECLRNVVFSSAACLVLQEGDRFWKLPEVFVRGPSIKYLRIPEDVLDRVPSEEAALADQGRGCVIRVEGCAAVAAHYRALSCHCCCAAASFCWRAGFVVAGEEEEAATEVGAEAVGVAAVVVVTEAAQEGAAATGGAAAEQELAAVGEAAVEGPAAKEEAAEAAMVVVAAVAGAAGGLSLVGAELRGRRRAPDSRKRGRGVGASAPSARVRPVPWFRWSCPVEYLSLLAPARW